MKEDIAASVYEDKSKESVDGLMKHWMMWPEAKTLKEYLQIKLEELKDRIPETAITRLEPLIQMWGTVGPRNIYLLPFRLL